MSTLMEKADEAEKALTPDEKRFLLDLEFIQSLANPSYLQYIASHDAKYLSDERFIAYLKYLSYFKEPQYSRHLLAPVLADALAEQQRFHWHYYRANRMNSTAPLMPDQAPSN